MTTHECAGLERLTEVVARGLGEIASALAEPPESEAIAAPNQSLELETAKQIMRVEAAKVAMASIIQYAGVGSPDMNVDLAFAHADRFVARAFAAAEPAIADTEEVPS